MTHPPDYWKYPVPFPTLGEGEVHVWWIGLARPEADLWHLASILNREEWERAGRFHFQRDRDHYVAARSGLRQILARYLRIEPQGVGFRYSEYGKPELDEPLRFGGLQFNLSHSGEVALLAVARGGAVGIDVERIRPDLADEGVARRFFSARETKVFASLPASLRAQAFFTCWTRKEAYIKARGEGLSFPLDRFDVSLAPGEPAALLETRGDPQEAGRWGMYSLDPGEGYLGALAVEGKGWELKTFRWG